MRFVKVVDLVRDGKKGLEEKWDVKMVLRGGRAIALLPKKWMDFVIAGDEGKTMWIYMEKLFFEGESLDG
jgi:NADH:ubiquinone oxidoreductase subunit F (NADH-binding)